MTADDSNNARFEWTPERQSELMASVKTARAVESGYAEPKMASG
jgi:hypothetical protein